MEKVLDFIRESKAELLKVSWPTKKQVWASSLVVVSFTIIVGAFLGLVDFGLTTLMSTIIGN